MNYEKEKKLTSAKVRCIYLPQRDTETGGNPCPGLKQLDVRLQWCNPSLAPSEGGDKMQRRGVSKGEEEAQ